MHEFDKDYWEQHWADSTGGSQPAHPYLAAEVAGLPTGTALDAGCGTGVEALWLAARGWSVTGADISSAALAAAAERAEAMGLAERTEWIEADLSRWEPERSWDLVVTSYAHPDTGQLPFYERIASWVAPGGTLLIVGHLHGGGHEGGGGHGHDAAHGHSASHAHSTEHEHGASHTHGAGPEQHPEGSTAALADVVALFSGPDWQIDAGYEQEREVQTGATPTRLHDVVVRAHRIR